MMKYFENKYGIKRFFYFSCSFIYIHEFIDFLRFNQVIKSSEHKKAHFLLVHCRL